MPFSAARPCSYPGCNTLVRGGSRCSVHKADTSFQRDPRMQALYNTGRWRVIRKAQLAREPWCKAHLEKGEYVPATDVDHIERHGGDPEKFFNGPFQSLCHACHSSKTAEEVGWAKRQGG